MNGASLDPLIVAPLLVPALGAVATMLARGAPRRAACISGAFTGLTVALGALLVRQADAGTIGVYALGGWRAPIGIVLVLDRMSALLVLLTGVLAFAASVSSISHPQTRSASFHALLLLLVMGVNGAFLTGDLFNLFVCFEILLAASYGLLVQAGGREAARAGLHYAALNLLGSSVFLVALGLVYGTTGTLNMAHLSVAASHVPAHARTLLAVGQALLLVVFGLKAALLPTHLWLPQAYAAAPGPVAALFAIMTKVGVGSMLRVLGTTFGFGGGDDVVASMVLLPLALATVAVGALGAIGTGHLRRLAAYLSLMSAGTLLVAVSLFDEAGTSAALYYMLHSTLATAALFLLADAIGRDRGADGDRLVGARPMRHAWSLGVPFAIASVAVAGLPPLSGFIGKVMVLQAGLHTSAGPWILGVVLGTSLFGVVALSRAGSRLFWKTDGEAPAATLDVPALTAAALLLGGIVGLVVLAEPVQRYTRAAAAQLTDPLRYVEAVLGGAP